MQSSITVLIGTHSVFIPDTCPRDISDIIVQGILKIADLTNGITFCCLLLFLVGERDFANRTMSLKRHNTIVIR